MTNPTWCNRPIADESHASDLDKQVAHHISLGTEKSIAEEAIHKDYKKKQHLQAAAFHIGAANKMSRAGQKKDAEKHLAHFRMHLSAAGIKHGSKVPDEVMAIERTWKLM